jgi:hypothetical protein
MKTIALLLGFFALTFTQMSYANPLISPLEHFDETLPDSGKGKHHQRVFQKDFYEDMDTTQLDPSTVLFSAIAKTNLEIIQENHEVIGEQDTEKEKLLLVPYQKTIFDIRLENNQIIEE